MVVFVGLSGNETGVLTAKPTCPNTSPSLRFTRTAADVLFTTDSANWAEFESRLRLRCVSIGTGAPPPGGSCETTRLKSASALRTPVVSTESRRSLPQLPGLAAVTSSTAAAAPFSSVQAAVAWPTATRTIKAWVPPLEKNCRTPYETGLSRSSPP